MEVKEFKPKLLELSDGNIGSLTIFDKDALEVIAATPLFNEKEKNELALASKSMDKAFFNSQVFRTYTEVIVSVLNDIRFPTPAAKYYQSLRELKVHSTELIYLLYEYETTKQNLRILEADLMDLQEELKNAEKESQKIRLSAEIKKKEIEIQKIMFMLKDMKKTADGRKQEIMQWNNIINQLEPLLIKDGIPIDDPNAHQLISYTVRFIKQIVSALITKTDFEPGEAANLIGQLTTSLKYVKENNLMNALLPFLDKLEIDFLNSQNLLEFEENPQNKKEEKAIQ